MTGQCVLRTQDGWSKRPCDEEHAFICERNINQQSIPLTIRCGNPQSTTIPPIQITTTTVTTTQNTTIQQLSSSTMKMKLHKTKKNNPIDPSKNSFIHQD
jgi:hypothetical protein